MKNKRNEILKREMPDQDQKTSITNPLSDQALQKTDRTAHAPDVGTVQPLRCFRLLFHGISVMAVGIVLLPVVFYYYTEAFTGKAVGVSLFIAACVERMWAMYMLQGAGRASSGAGRDWTAIAVGYAYTLTLGAAVSEFLVRRCFPGMGFVAGGAAVYVAGVALRYWAFYTLRHQFHVDVSDTSGERHLVREGPYRIMRHPLYLGGCLEIIGLPMFLGTWGALLFGTLIFIPLEITRAYYEERFLRKLFGSAYRQYKEEVWAFCPNPFRSGRRP
ncbi:MAG: isoprenylcysteine carboxylmethyltransferase family protein [Kiritimatiellae bacterium]|nr:isoprenylcysteine carboxylmethyltransferase family protein [Kiritimatiellia bacterium]